ncbi:MAG: hypothetical protein CM15mP55_3760 [Hyphomicrobiales bacterium]|nr:MAG: hypothetical protein CM15mP55_3760 [Hyphomicrobiales bacterium]
MKIPTSNLLGGEEGQGFYQLMQQLPAERLIIANQGVGAIERAIQLTVDYTRERNTFGNAVFDYQNTQYKLAECKATWMAARAWSTSWPTSLCAANLMQIPPPLQNSG